MGLLLTGSICSFAQSLPQYPAENLITDAKEKTAILEAISLDLTIKGIKSCKHEIDQGGHSWLMVDYFLAYENNENNVDVYLFKGEQPLVVLRSKEQNHTHSKVNYIDFKVFTNLEMTSIFSIPYVEYQKISQQTNVGTIASPAFESRVNVKKLGEYECL